MIDPAMVPLAWRSLRFPVGLFSGATTAGKVATYRHNAQANRVAARTSAAPLLCLARAAWWEAAADAAAARSR